MIIINIIINIIIIIIIVYFLMGEASAKARCVSPNKQVPLSAAIQWEMNSCKSVLFNTCTWEQQ